MILICPTITAENSHTYREQIERVEKFTNHVHLDLMDGVFTPNTSIDPEHLWMPDSMTCDVHAMYENPASIFAEVMKLSVRTFIAPVECEDKFKHLAHKVHQHGAQFGVALLHDTPVDALKQHLAYTDHVLLFSGNLGYQGGSTADLSILGRVVELKNLKPSLEIGWDGGVDDTNCAALVQAGISVINSGGFIQFASDPAAAYHRLVDISHQN